MAWCGRALSMGTGDDKKTTFDLWLNSERGRYIFDRQKTLITDLVAPVQGESVLDISCGAGHFLEIFQDQQCLVTGIDSSADNLKRARARLGDAAELILGSAEDLPFSDNEFDIVTVIYAMGMSSDPAKVIAEAIRVSHRRVFISAES